MKPQICEMFVCLKRRRKVSAASPSAAFAAAVSLAGSRCRRSLSSCFTVG